MSWFVCNPVFLCCFFFSLFHICFCMSLSSLSYGRHCVFPGCYPCPGPSLNPIALGSRWLAYAENKVVCTYTHIHPVQKCLIREATYLQSKKMHFIYFLPL